MKIKPDRHILKPLCVVLFAVFGSPASHALDAQTNTTAVALNNVEFNSNLIDLPADSKSSALKRFSNSGSAFPGSYRADIYVNDYWVARRDIVIREEKPRGNYVCVTPAMLQDLQLDYSRLPDAKGLQTQSEGSCIDLAQYVPGAVAAFNSGELRLDISLPQIYQRRDARGYVNPDLWTPGTPLAGFLNYSVNAYHNNQDNVGSNNQYFFSAQAGVNIGAWRLRTSSSVSQQSDGNNKHTQYQRLSTYAQRDIIPWRSVLTIGETYTPSDLFTSFAFRGAQLRSDDRMLPDSQLGYAPTIRGVADSNAKVTVKQGNNIIYETSVPPGPFQIEDLFNTGYAGDLDVIVTETDGRIKQFTVPYAAVPQLLRPGMSRYSVSVGELRASGGSAQPGFLQANYQRGVNNTATIYTGGLAADGYFTALLGTAISSRIGAVAADITHSQAIFDNSSATLPSSLTGQSYRLSYSLLVNATKTNLMLAAYRYSTAGYMDFGEFAYAKGMGARSQPIKSRFTATLNQPLKEGWGYLNLVGSTQEYWNRTGRDTQYMVGYNNSYKQLNYGLSATRTRDAVGNHVNQYMLSLTMPLGKMGTNLSSSFTSDSEHNRSQQVSVSGTAGELSNMSYSVYANNSHSGNNSNSENYGVYGQYSGSLGSFTASASRARGSSQEMLGLSGGMVFHPGGITLSQSLGESIAVIEAKGAEGARVENMNGTRINSQGYAVATNLMSYRMNDVSVDPKDMSEDVELQESTSRIAPTAGAIVMVKFNTKQGKAAMVNLAMKSGESAPLGADILTADGTPVAVVGQSGRAFLRGVDNQKLTLRWGDNDNQQCSFSYQLPAGNDTPDGQPTLRTTSATCQ